MARRTPTACVMMEKPATLASPAVGGSSVVSILIVVVLPAPFEPSRPKISPALTERVSASTDVNAPKRRLRPLISRTTLLIRKRWMPASLSTVFLVLLFGGLEHLIVPGFQDALF